MTSKNNKKNVCTSVLGGSFLNLSTCSDFAKVFTHFAQISTDFVLIFTKSKVLGVRFHPRLLHQCTEVRWE